MFMFMENARTWENEIMEIVHFENEALFESRHGRFFLHFGFEEV